MENQVHLHEFHLRLSLTRGQTAILLSAAFLALLISPIATEQVTLTTYYPAPAGVYNNMVTIGNTWLARDAVPSTGQPSFVEIGSNAGVSAGTKLAVMNNNGYPLVGVNTTSPQAMLDVSSGAVRVGNLISANPPPGADGSIYYATDIPAFRGKINGVWSPLGGGISQCETPIKTCHGNCTITCDPGYFAVGGGESYAASAGSKPAFHGAIYFDLTSVSMASYPASSNSWHCAGSSSSSGGGSWDHTYIMCYAQCCK